MGLSGHPLGAKPGPALLDEEHHEEAHWHRLQHQGYTSEPIAIIAIAAPPDIAPLSAHLLSL